jgi:hypothetical protein
MRLDKKATSIVLFDMFLVALAALSIAVTIHLLTSHLEIRRPASPLPGLSDGEMVEIVLKELRR